MTVYWQDFPAALPTQPRALRRRRTSDNIIGARSRQQCEGVPPTHVHARSGCGLVLSFLSRDLRLGEHPSDPPHACVSLIPRQAAMANVHRLAQKEKSVILVCLKIYLIRLLPFLAAELTAQRCKNTHRHIP